MKKILLASMVLGAAILSITCERNSLIVNNENDPLLLLNNLNNTTAPAPTVIYIYNAGQHDGNLVDRFNADNICIAAGPPAGTTTVHAFLSVSAADQIIDLVPSVYQSLPVIDGGGATTISNSWTNMWDGTIDITLYTASVIPVAGLEWWSGSNSNGTYNAASCDGGSGGWTSNSSIVFGMSGNSNFITFQWIQFASIYPCNTANYLLCVAY